MRLSADAKHELAAQYVLGTLDGPARKRFEFEVIQDDQVRRSVWYWEQQLNQLGENVKPLTPEHRVWLAIQQRLFGTPAVSSSTPVQNNVVTLQPKQNGWWKGVAALASAAAVVLAVLLGRVEPPVPVPQYTEIAFFQDAEQSPLWLLELSDETLSIRATERLTAQANKDYELWIVAKDGRAPISLGLLPKNGQLTLAKDKYFDELDIAVLAVSLEPLGGSPNGSPTEVLYTSEIITL